MSSVAHKITALPEGQQVSSPVQSVHATTNATPASNIETFPTPTARPQDIILNLYLEGKSPKEIVRILGASWTETKVLAIAQSEWMQKRLQEVGENGDVSNESINKLLVGHSFQAAVRVGQLIQSKNENVALAACRLVFNVAVTPSRKLPEERERPLTEEEVKARSAQIDRKLAESKLIKAS